jgi:hypothetical protein
MLGLLGCATTPPYKAYQGEKKLSDLAVIQCDSERAHGMWRGLDRAVWITKIDAKATLKPSSLHLHPPEEAWVESGRHYLEVRYTDHGGHADGKLWLDAEAGKTYIVRKKIEGYGVRFWIEEKESGKVVGGSARGGEPEPEK